MQAKTETSTPRTSQAQIIDDDKRLEYLRAGILASLKASYRARFGQDADPYHDHYPAMTGVLLHLTSRATSRDATKRHRAKDTIRQYIKAGQKAAENTHPPHAFTNYTESNLPTPPKTTV